MVIGEYSLLRNDYYLYCCHKLTILQAVLDMHLHSQHLETTKGLDPAYDEALSDYFGPYHAFVDRLIRMRVNEQGKGLPSRVPDVSPGGYDEAELEME